MDTIKINSKKTKIIAHRGCSRLEAENSCAAFVASGNRSYFGIEADVHPTADNGFVIIHDNNAFRVSGVDMVVENSTIEELSKIRLFSPYDCTPRNDLVIPTLTEYIKICKAYGKAAVLELKGEFAKDLLRGIIKEIQRENYIESTIFISFSFENLVSLREILPNCSAQLLAKHIDDDLILRLRENSLDLDISYKAIDKATVKKLHKNGILVNCWTVNSPEIAKKLIYWRVDFITTDILE